MKEGQIRVVAPNGAEIDLTREALSQLATAIRTLGSADGLREQLVEVCRSAERRFGLSHGDVRETITGPIVDALHAPGTLLRKELAGGMVFHFTYRSKIARDFVLSPDPTPDHVWEPQTTRLLLHMARHARHVVIGGGYIGEHAILVAHAMNAQGGICHAFEPNHDAATLMRRNAANNRITNLVVSELALWNASDGWLALVGKDSHAHPERVDAAATGDKFRTITLDAYCKARAIDGLDLIMLDIEGGEQAALEGAVGFLGRPKEQAPAVVFEIHRSYVDWSKGLDQTPPVRLLLDAGYRVFAIRDFQSNVPMGNCLIELLPLDAIYLEGPPHGFNMLAVKDEALLDPAIFRRCRDKSPKLLLYQSPRLHHPTEWLTHLPDWLRGDDVKS
jgi:FkbM family methyltransferase